MATAEQTANGVAAPAEAAQPIPSAAQDPTTSQSAAPLAASDTPMETPAATEGAAGKGVATRFCYLYFSEWRLLRTCLLCAASAAFIGIQHPLSCLSASVDSVLEGALWLARHLSYRSP